MMHHPHLIWTVAFASLLVVAFAQPRSEGGKCCAPLCGLLAPCWSYDVEAYPSVHERDVVKIWWEAKWMRLARVFHWAYALPNDQISHFFATNRTHGSYSIRPIHKYRSLYSVGPNPRRQPLLDPHDSLSLAYRLQGIELPYHPLNCNCRHYLDYVVYGRTFGFNSNPDLSDWRMKKSCPLHRILTRGMDFQDDDFYLEDGYGKRYEVNRIPD